MDGLGIEVSSAAQQPIRVEEPMPNFAMCLFVCHASAAMAVAQCTLQWASANLNAGTGPGRLFAAQALPNGDLVVGGDFVGVDAVAANHIARFDGTTWSPLGGGMDGPVAHVASLPNGAVVAIGSFTVAGGVPAAGIALWQAGAWSAHPAAPAPPGTAWAVFADGRLATAYQVSTGPTSATIAVELWDGTGWRTIGTGFGSSSTLPFPTVVDLAVSPHGDLLAAGTWQGMAPMGSAGPSGFRELVRWNGTTWDWFHDLPDPVALTVDERGDVLLANDRTIVRWDGTGWSTPAAVPLGIGIRALGRLPGGDLVVAGLVGPALPASPPLVELQRIAIGSGQVSSLWFAPTPVAVHAEIDVLALHRGGTLLVGGWFAAAAGQPATNLAYLRAPCAATAVVQPTACVGPGGPLQLVATRLPWLGETFAATTTGFVANSFGVATFGLQSANVPLASVVPQGLANCVLATSAEAVSLLVPVAGTAVSAFVVQNLPVFVGVTLAHQVLQVEFDPAIGLVSVSGSNALALTVGVF